MINFDESCDGCNCLCEFCLLVDMLIKDIHHLELETVQTRYELSRYLSHPYDKYMKSDILSNLTGCYSDNPAYQTYVRLLHDGQDPMESDEWVKQILNQAHVHTDSE